METMSDSKKRKLLREAQAFRDGIAAAEQLHKLGWLWTSDLAEAVEWLTMKAERRETAVKEAEEVERRKESLKAVSHRSETAKVIRQEDGWRKAMDAAVQMKADARRKKALGRVGAGVTKMYVVAGEEPLLKVV